jgi:PKD repeat protein
MTHTYSNPGDKDVTLKVTNNQGTDTITRTVTVTATPTVPVAGKIHEGGDNTSTLEWGTTGDLSIKIKNTAPPPVPNFCIGNQCPENEGNKAPNKGTPRGPYANRDQADINGTIKVENKLKFGSTETLCIGSKCGTNAGDPAYSTQYYNSTHPMDGPVYMNYEESNGLVMADSVCWGSNC